MTLQKIGLFLPHLGLSQLAFCAIHQVNTLLQKKRNIDIVLFYEDLYQPCINPLCGAMCSSELRNFNGTIISTTLNTTIKTAKTVANFQRHIFYVWDIEWYRPMYKDYLYNLQAYRDPNIDIVLRHPDYKKPFTDYANRDVTTFVDNVDIEHIIGETNEH